MFTPLKLGPRPGTYLHSSLHFLGAHEHRGNVPTADGFLSSSCDSFDAGRPGFSCDSLDGGRPGRHGTGIAACSAFSCELLRPGI